MEQISYKDFTVIIYPEGSDGSYVARTLATEDAGDGHSTFKLSDLIVEETTTGKEATTRNTIEPINRHVKVVSLISHPERIFSVSSSPPSVIDSKTFGERLFKNVFKDGILSALEQSIAHTRRRKEWLRLRFNLSSVPELAVLPWEYLRHQRLSQFFAQDIDTPVVRYLDMEDSIKELLVEGPLRMLVVVSCPSNYRRLDVEREWKNLKESLEPLADQQLITVERLDNATTPALLERLQDRLLENPYHIFHYIGHGVFDEQSGQGSLLLENDQGEGELVSGEILGNLLRDHHTLRLAVINACEGARISRTDSYAGIAQDLLRHARIPAVIAMQFEISDEAAIIFAGRFYDALAGGYPVEAALSQARKAIRFVGKNEVEWATPVLYMRAGDGRMRVKRLSEKDPKKNGIESPLPPAPAPEPDWHPLAEHFQGVIRALSLGQMVPFLGLDVNLYGRPSSGYWQPGDSLPGSEELASHLARVFEYPSPNIPDLASVSQFATIKPSKLGRLYNKFSEIFNDVSHQPTELHQLLARIAANNIKYLKTNDPLLRRFLIVTTSYDNLLERAFKGVVPIYHVISYVAEGEQQGKFLHATYMDRGGSTEPELKGEPQLISSPNDYKGLADDHPVILKLPGTMENAEQRFAITEDHFADYLTHKPLTTLLPSVLTGKLKSSSHLFLGYSLRDWNMRGLIYRIWGKQQHTYDTWAVLPVAQALDERFWEASGADIIRIDLKEYINCLAERIAQS